MKRKAISKDQLRLFDDCAVPDKEGGLTERQITEQIIRKETELEHAYYDYCRHFHSRKALELAAATKHSNRAKVDGEWMDVRFAKYLLKFINDYPRRKSQLEWEIAELKKMLPK